MTYHLGIDLGTVYTCAAVARDGGVEVCQLTHTSQVVPSVVSIREDGGVLSGEAAERRSVTHPERTVHEFKRRFGDPAPIVLGGKPYGVDQITGYLFDHIVGTVAELQSARPDRLAVTHPATWGPYKLDLLRTACHLADVADPLLIPEPVAAAVAYEARASLPVGAHLLVYDLGGGTFDAAIVRMGERGPVLVGQPSGIERFGGVDFDQTVFAYVDRTTDGLVSGADSGDPDARAALARLRQECTAAKEALSSDTEVEIPVFLPNLRTSVRLTRTEFEAMIGPTLQDTHAVSRRVIESANLTPGQIETVLLVGGSSRIPLVASLLQEYLGRPVVLDTNPKSSVAIGAALVADRAAYREAYQRNAATAATAPRPAPTTAGAPPPVAATKRVPAAAPGPAAARPGAPRDRRRRPVGAWIAAAIVVALIGAGAFFLIGGSGGDDDGGGGTAGGDEAAGTGQDLAIAGTEAWSDTGIDLAVGDLVTIQASGEINHAEGDEAVNGPDGVLNRPDLYQFNVTDAADHNALIGRIGEAGEPFFVGAASEFQAATAGRLYLGVNDAGTENNAGEYQVAVEVSPAP